ncbi:hypothetical protein [Sphaerotilus uruguayifluvii]|uniref:Uncharacterized protein n=1 Tax=Sphaerotilus uruguayifluvii TaxID=2735897 RepID=A0ABX2GAQ7_9BURK|nr:hypothetical protein [Leptothrix sp. C29]NRT58655.1 hypothetical protein [Leptothrix sp. C29]
MSNNQSKQVFVAYAYGLYDKRDYRKVFSSLEKVFGVRFIFADEKITNMHILQKILSYIRSSDFSIFDISAWNPNVTLELGIALALSENWYICFNPSQTNLSEVPSDIRGIDRIQYISFADLEDKLTVLLDQRYPRSSRIGVDDYLAGLESDITDLLKREPGLGVVEVSDILGVHKRMAQVAVRQMLESGKLRSEGKTKGVKYFIAEPVVKLSTRRRLPRGA